MSRVLTYHWEKSSMPKLSLGIGTNEDMRVRAALTPLLKLAQDARWANGACFHLFDLLALGCEDALHGENFDKKQAAIEELIFQVSAFVGSFSGPGWVSSLRHSPQCLKCTYQEHLCAIRTAVGGLSIHSPITNRREIEAKVMEEIEQVTSLLASFGGLENLASFGSLQRQAAFAKELIPLLHSSPATHNLSEEISFGLIKYGSTNCLGPHSSLRHPALRLLWWQRARGKEFLPWSELFKLLEVSAGWQSRYRDPNDLSGDPQRIGGPSELRSLLADPFARMLIISAIEAKSPWLTVTGCGSCSPQLLDAAIDPMRTLADEFLRLKMTTPSLNNSSSSPQGQTLTVKFEIEDEDRWESSLIGREREIESLWVRVAANRSLPLIFILYGPQGIGKSSIAEALARRGTHSQRWSSIRFASLATCSSLEDACLSLASSLNIPLHFIEPPLSPTERLVIHFSWRNSLKPNREVLILDDVDGMMPRKDSGVADGAEAPSEDMSHLFQLLQILYTTAPFLDIIVTSRSSYSIDDEPPVPAFNLGLIQDLGDDKPPLLPFDLESHEVSLLDQESAVKLLASHSGSMESSTRRISAECKGVPATLKLLGCCLGRNISLNSASWQGSSIPSIFSALAPNVLSKLGKGASSLLLLLVLLGSPVSDEDLLFLLTTTTTGKEGGDGPEVHSTPRDSSSIAVEMCSLYDHGLLSFCALSGKHKVESSVLTELMTTLFSLSSSSRTQKNSSSSRTQKKKDDSKDPLWADPLRADPLRADPLRADPLRADPLWADHEMMMEIVDEASSRLLTITLSLGSLFDSLWHLISGGVVFSLGGDKPIAPIPAAVSHFGRKQHLIQCIIQGTVEWISLFPSHAGLIRHALLSSARKHLNRLCRLTMSSHHLASFSISVAALACTLKGRSRDKSALLLVASRGLSHSFDHREEAQHLLSLVLEEEEASEEEPTPPPHDDDSLPFEQHLLLARAEAASAIGSSPEAVVLLKRFARSDSPSLPPSALFDYSEALRLLSNILLDPSRTPGGIATEGSQRSPSIRIPLSPESSQRSLSLLSRPDSSSSSVALTFLAAHVTMLEKWSSASFPTENGLIHPLVARAQVRLNSCRLNCGLASEAEEKALEALHSIRSSMGPISLDAAIATRELAICRLTTNTASGDVCSQIASSVQVMLRFLPSSHPQVSSSLRALTDAADLDERSTEIKEAVDEPSFNAPELSAALQSLFKSSEAASSPRPAPEALSPTGSVISNTPISPRNGSRLPPLDKSFTSRVAMEGSEGVLLSGGSFSRLRLRDALVASRENSGTSGSGAGRVGSATSRSVTLSSRLGKLPEREEVLTNPLFDRMTRTS